MTGRKTAADDFGYKRGAGAYSKEVKLNRGSFPNSVPGTDSSGHGKYTNDEQVTHRVTSDDVKFATPERLTNDAAKDIFDNVERNSGNGAPGPIKYGVD